MWKCMSLPIYSRYQKGIAFLFCDDSAVCSYEWRSTRKTWCLICAYFTLMSCSDEDLLLMPDQTSCSKATWHDMWVESLSHVLDSVEWSTAVDLWENGKQAHAEFSFFFFFLPRLVGGCLGTVSLCMNMSSISAAENHLASRGQSPLWVSVGQRIPWIMAAFYQVSDRHSKEMSFMFGLAAGIWSSGLLFITSARRWEPAEEFRFGYNRIRRQAALQQCNRKSVYLHAGFVLGTLNFLGRMFF